MVIKERCLLFVKIICLRVAVFAISLAFEQSAHALLLRAQGDSFRFPFSYTVYFTSRVGPWEPYATQIASGFVGGPVREARLFSDTYAAENCLRQIQAKPLEPYLFVITIKGGYTNLVVFSELFLGEANFNRIVGDQQYLNIYVESAKDSSQNQQGTSDEKSGTDEDLIQQLSTVFESDLTVLTQDFPEELLTSDSLNSDQITKALLANLSETEMSVLNEIVGMTELEKDQLFSLMTGLPAPSAAPAPVSVPRSYSARQPSEPNYKGRSGEYIYRGREADTSNSDYYIGRSGERIYRGRQIDPTSTFITTSSQASEKTYGPVVEFGFAYLWTSINSISGKPFYCYKVFETEMQFDVKDPWNHIGDFRRLKNPYNAGDLWKYIGEKKRMNRIKIKVWSAAPGAAIPQR